MKQLFFSVILAVCATLQLSAQEVNVDKKTGMVDVDGSNAFYMIARNKNVFEKDFSLQTLNKQEVAYMKAAKESAYNQATGRYEDVLIYVVTFSQSGNSCIIDHINGFSTFKYLAKQVAAAELIKDNRVSPQAEQKFIVMHRGTFLKDPNADANKVVVNVANTGNNMPARPVDISVKNENIYNGGELAGTYKMSVNGAMRVVKVYNGNGEMVAEALHEDKNDNADWQVNTPADGRNMTLLYSPAEPLMKLFKVLVEKGYL